MNKKLLLSIVFINMFFGLYGQSSNDAVIYFDTSVSMKPYIQESSAYTNIIRNLRGQILINAGVESYSISDIGASVSIPDQDNSNRIREYSTEVRYDKWTTNLISAVDSINYNINNSKFDVGFLITDAVLCTKSGSGYDLFEMKKALRRTIIDNNLALGVIGIKSDFNGNIYPVMEGVSPYPWQGKRPFYIFIFTRNSNFEELENIMSQMILFCKNNNFTYKDMIISPVYKYRYKFINNFPEIIFQSDSYRDIFLMESSTESQVNYFLEKKIKPGEKANLLVPIKMYPEPKQHNNLYQFEFDYELSNNISKNEIDITSNENDVEIAFFPSFTREIDETKQIILKVKPKIELSNKPTIWAEWSTNDDSVIENANKTMNISELMSYIYNESINRAINEVNTMNNAQNIFTINFNDI